MTAEVDVAVAVATRAKPGSDSAPARFLIFVACVLGAIAPALYGATLFGQANLFAIAELTRNHILLNWICNLFVLSASMRAKGTLDTAARRMLTSALISHGILAFSVLAFREYFSRPVMLASGALSLAVIAALMGARAMGRGPRAALIGDVSPEVKRWMSGVAEVVSDPSVDLRTYDIAVVDVGKDLSSAWTSALARAMLAGCEVRHAAEYLEYCRGRASIDHVSLEDISAPSSSYELAKRCWDIAIVVFFLPLALIVLVIALALSLVVMGRPVFFVQERVGRGGRVFRMWKLRTMRALRADEVGTATKKNDQRITPYGAFLRRFRIDELPQLWNVLIGDMSLIGPRPEQPGLTREYTSAMPAFAFRHLVRPGITGWAQVRAGYAADLAETREKLSYDLYYVKNFSLALDVHILTRTIWTLVSGSGVR